MPSESRLLPAGVPRQRALWSRGARSAFKPAAVRKLPTLVSPTRNNENSDGSAQTRNDNTGGCGERIHLVAVGGCRVDVERTNLNQTEPEIDVDETFGHLVFSSG